MTRTCADAVMLIDDNEIDLFINEKIIEFNSFANKVISLSSAQEALDFLKTAEETQIPQLIFLDLNMPVIDGFKFLFLFSKLPDKIRNNCSVVVLSSSNNPNDRKKVEVNPDVILFLSKPLDDAKLEMVRGALADLEKC